MYQTTDDVSQAIESYCRTWRVQLETTDEPKIIYSGSIVLNASSAQQSTAKSDDIELGSVCGQTWTLNITQTSKQWLGNQYKLYLYLCDLRYIMDPEHYYTTYADLEQYTYEQLAAMTIEEIEQLGAIVGGELIPMGEFVCVKCKNTGDGAEITLADKLYFADKKLKDTPFFQWAHKGMTAKDVENKCLEYLGLENDNTWAESRYLMDINNAALTDSGGNLLVSADNNFIIDRDKISNECTIRQMLGYIASANGQFATVNRYGRYQRKWYGLPCMTINPDTIDTPTISETQNKIVGIKCKASESNNPSTGDTSGTTGRIIEFENPFVDTIDKLKSIWRQIENYTWYTADINMRLGDPRLDIGDVITYNGRNIPITSLAYTFDGGLSAQITSVGKNTQEQELII